MATKSQHAPGYEPVLALLRELREEAGLTQRGLGQRLGKPQSWVHNCETGNRRVDVAEFAAWARACVAEPEDAFRRFLDAGRPQEAPAGRPRRRPRQPRPRA
jgi:transcriptional regulator with XRE-family HTH domain